MLFDLFSFRIGRVKAENSGVNTARIRQYSELANNAASYYIFVYFTNPDGGDT